MKLLVNGVVYGIKMRRSLNQMHRSPKRVFARAKADDNRLSH